MFARVVHVPFPSTSVIAVALESERAWSYTPGKNRLSVVIWIVGMADALVSAAWNACHSGPQRERQRLVLAHCRK